MLAWFSAYGWLFPATLTATAIVLSVVVILAGRHDEYQWAVVPMVVSFCIQTIVAVWFAFGAAWAVCLTMKHVIM